MPGKRIINPSLIHTTFNEAIENNALALVDWTGLLEARPIPVKLLGNCYMQGSETGAVYRNTILPTDKYIRVSIDGGVTWKILNMSNLDQLHNPVTIAEGSEAYLSVDEFQVLTFTPQPTHPPVTIAGDSVGKASIGTDQVLHINIAGITVVNNRTDLTEVVNNTIVYDITVQSFYIYNNNTWVKIGNDVVSGDGMNFVTNESVKLGTPSSITSTSENVVTEHSHTHKLESIDVTKVNKFVVKYGALYNWFAVTDARNIAPVGFHVPTWDEWETLCNYLGGASVAGGKLKSTDSLRWNSPNTGADNSSGFNAYGAGERYYTGIPSYFVNIKNTTFYWVSDMESGLARARGIMYNNTNVNTDLRYSQFGSSLRFIADSGSPTIANGNDGKVYPCITIGTQTWTASNCDETKYRNGDWIHGFDNGVYTLISTEEWDALTTGAMCYYDDNTSNGGSEIPVEIISEHNSLKGLQGGTATERYHLTAVQVAKVNTIGFEDIAFDFNDVIAGTAKDYTLDISATFAYNILSCFLETDNGTLTGVSVKIGTTAITGLSSITVDTAVDETTATAANSVAIGNRVYLSVATTYTGTPTVIRGKLKIQRT